MSGEPYASVILPVHKRSLVLLASLQSVRLQTVENIEIIVAGDGATQNVAETVEVFASKDARIRFLRLPKAPGRGERNRDHAVRTARSDRIFYIDDDDLWLPDHIEVLAPWLDRLDIVSTPIWSVMTSGHLAMALGNYGSPILRDLLARRVLKLIHDTHLAHRKTAYLRLDGGGWVEDPERRPVLRLLSQFAQDPSFRWATIPNLTALSLSSPPRKHYSDAQRLAELMNWLPRLAMPQIAETLRSSACLAPFLIEMMLELPPLERDHLSGYLSRLDIEIQGPDHRQVKVPGDIENVLRVDLSPQQIREAETVLGLFQGRANDKNRLETIILNLAESPQGMESRTSFVGDLLIRSVGIDDAIQVAKQTSVSVPKRASLRYLLLAYLYLKKGKLPEALEYVHQTQVECNDFMLECRVLTGHISMAQADHKAARVTFEDVLTVNPSRPDIWLALSVAYQLSGDIAQAICACKQGLSHAPTDDALRHHLSNLSSSSPA